MDAFFVEVERRRRPELVGKAVLVGGAGPRGVVASASYEARSRGARSAMPMAHARRLCPHAVVVPPSHNAYSAASREVFAVVGEMVPSIEKLSVDEAFLEIGGLGLLHGSPEAFATALRARIKEETGLPSSVGIATSKLVAKLASNDAKPDGIHIVRAGTELAYLHPKPVQELWGVGEATRARLEEIGVETIGDIAAFPRQTLVGRLGETIGGHLWDLAHARDDRPVGAGEGAKSISVEVTYPQDIVDADEVERELLRHADRLAYRLRRAGYAATTIQVKVRYADFTTVVRSHAHQVPVATVPEIFGTARDLLARTEAATRPIRLLGVGADGLVDASDPRQLGLAPRSREDLEAAVGDVRDRFGRHAVQPARLTDDAPSQPVIADENSKSQ